MILLDISLFFLDSLNPVSVFLAERAAAAGGLGYRPSSGRRMTPTPVRRCPAPEVPAGGRELQLSREVCSSGGSSRRRALGEGRQQLGRKTNMKDQKMARCRSARKSYPRMRALQQLTCLVGKDEYREKIMK